MLHFSRQPALLGTLQLRHECPFSSIWCNSISVRSETSRCLISGYAIVVQSMRWGTLFESSSFIPPTKADSVVLSRLRFCITSFKSASIIQRTVKVLLNQLFIWSLLYSDYSMKWRPLVNIWNRPKIALYVSDVQVRGIITHPRASFNAMRRHYSIHNAVGSYYIGSILWLEGYQFLLQSPGQASRIDGKRVVYKTRWFQKLLSLLLEPGSERETSLSQRGKALAGLYF